MMRGSILTSIDNGGKYLHEDIKSIIVQLGLDFTEEEVNLLSSNVPIKGLRGKQIYQKLIDLDLLLKKILVANEDYNLYDLHCLSHTLHLRFKDACEYAKRSYRDFYKQKIDMIFAHSIFSDECFYNPYQLPESFRPVITVLMPTYNSEKYVADAVWSVLKQDYKDFELLIVNEYGSNDNTVKLIKMFRDDRIRIIHNTEKLGLAESLNIGILESRGEYIARLDADDFCCCDRFRLQLEFLEKNPDYGVCGSWQHHFGIDVDLIHKVPASHEELKAHFIYRCELCHSTLMLRKQSFIEHGLFYDKNYAAEDYELWTRAVHKIKFANIPKVLGEYRVGTENITATKLDELSYESGEIAFRNITQYLKVEIPEDHIRYLGSWRKETNNIRNRKKYIHHISIEKRILTDMWNNNLKLGVYDQDSLLYVINKRWRWLINSWRHGTELDEVLDISRLFEKYNNLNLYYIKAQVVRIVKYFIASLKN